MHSSDPQATSLLTRSIGMSYLVIAGILILSAWLHLASLFVTVLFALFALEKLNFSHRKWLAITLFLVLVVAALYGFGFFCHRAIRDLPKIVADVIPKMVKYADNHGIDLPFSDLDDIKEAAPNMARDSIGYLGNFAKLATKESLMLLAGIVVAIGIFVNSAPKGPPGNLYAQYEAAIQSRFRAFYRSFETVMGAQLLISLINTIATAVFVLSTSMLPYAGIVIPLTFICGLLPIVGNLISNTLIVGIAFGLVSPQMALGALVFLVVIHKMEYFFNSKIIGSRILHPMWLTLIGLILGESLMGIPGVILAPVILNFLKVEGSRYPVGEPQQ
ncbi:MAG: AI-2E family transporter [Verrucomicrobia bacterium]|nr:AI-2E family transporter [Verrucomicrobiota bacterium]